MARQSDKTDKEATEPAQRAYFSTGPSRGWLHGLVAAVVIILVFLAGAAVANHRHPGPLNKPGVMRELGRGGSFGPHRGFGGGMGNTVTANGQTRASGVVTAVTGDSFTIAGHGSTTNVITNSSTQYHGGNQVKQNDSVVVRGTIANGSLTASQVVINP